MLTLRPATMEDAADLFAWRNDPVTRAMFVNTGEVLWDDHLRWLEATLDREDRKLSIGELGGVSVGTTRLDIGEETEVSITVAPEWRSRGLPRSLLNRALPESGCIAHVKRENFQCRRLVALVGFDLVEDGEVQLWRHPGHDCTISKRLLPPARAVPPAMAFRAAQAPATETLSLAASG